MDKKQFKKKKQTIKICFFLFEELYFESVLCENDEVTLNCTVGNSIDDINITIHGVQDTCSITDDVNRKTKIALDSTSYSSCIGQHSCVLTDKMLNVSLSVLEKTRKLLIEFDCVRKYEMHTIKQRLFFFCIACMCKIRI